MSKRVCVAFARCNLSLKIICSQPFLIQRINETQIKKIYIYKTSFQQMPKKL